MTYSSISDTVWFITGCSTGLGRALAEAALAAGARVAVTARDSKSVSDLVAQYPGRALALNLDVTRSAEVRDAVDECSNTFGHVDVLVNNAGYGYLAAVEEGVKDEVCTLFDTNFFGPVSLIQAVLPIMRARRCGHIINITSIRGLAGGGGSGYYSATKFALEGLTESLREEVAEFGIKVTAVSPGAFRTDWAGRSLRRSTRTIKHYTQGAENRYETISKRDGTQAGDPSAAAQAIIALVRSDDVPGHLLLGTAAMTTMRKKMANFADEIDAWESTSQSTDFPISE
ncbi:oxidoreductase [Paraburkholderia sp. ZP32-5]|uniref:oxidoreductase n=1 Tax=Paraburkholderia sp. ZP32-5 TaxID=2883245 RepID=UPI001F3E2B23|nr:oxidoreductase [Paraburkholderia sp. ZP32-5]